MVDVAAVSDSRCQFVFQCPCITSKNLLNYHTVDFGSFVYQNNINSSGAMDVGNLGNLSSGQKDELMDQVRQQIAVANAQELLTVSKRSPSVVPR